VKMIERQRVKQAAADAAKKLEDATKDAEETASGGDRSLGRVREEGLRLFAGFCSTTVVGRACCT
jgi:hypothetical protein